MNNLLLILKYHYVGLVLAL